MSASLCIEALIAGRGAFRLPPLTLDVASGTFIAMIGPNGGGKTTLLKTIAGLLPAVSGAVDFGTCRPPPAYLPPPGSLSVALPVAHVVALGRAAARGWSPVLGHEDHRAALAALDRMGIVALAARPFDAVSSGQQQLALMARLLVQGAGLCLLDEPTAMLDPPHAAHVERAMRLLADEGRVVIASTHDLALAAQSDVVIAVGGTVAVGDPASLLSATALSSLYGSAFELCACCHQPTAATTSA